jgi:hypothetical protein
VNVPGERFARITILFRNTWSWGNTNARPELHQSRPGPNPVIELNHAQLGKRGLYCEGSPELFTENKTNYQRLFGVESRTPYVKDGINNYIVNGATDAVNPLRKGTKAAAHYALTIEPAEQKIIRIRLLRVQRIEALGARYLSTKEIPVSSSVVPAILVL